MANKNIFDKDFILLDGAMGTMLQQKGMELGTVPETLNITKPDWIIDIHKQYIDAGSDVVYANTFGANRYKMANTGYSVDELIGAAINNAKEAAKGTETLVALDMGPIGQLLEPTGSLSFEEAYDIFKEEVIAGRNSGADIIVIETMTDLMETKAAILAAKENSDLQVMCTMTFEDNKRTFTGCSVSAMCLTVQGLGVDALGVNCSLGPKELEPVIAELTQWTNLPVIVKPNAGLPDPVTNLYNVNAAQFAEFMKDLRKYGIKVFGGCCGTTPEFISALADMLKKEGNPIKAPIVIPSAVCSATNTVIVDQPRVVGERINPTGKKVFKQALIDNDMDYILGQALEQTSAGADILDVNVGLPGIDERQMMIDTVKSLQSVVDVPLQLDSTIPEVLDSALRIYNGKPIVNSVNGEEESLNNILPIVKKYGAAVIGLALDKNGIPKKAQDRVAIAKKIMDRAVAIGIPKQDIYIDCLTLTASAEQEGVMETLNALHTVKHELGLRTVLGVSNISFGLPNRVLVNHIFLTMAMQSGLDLAIINPNVYEMMGAVRAYKLLANIDKNSVDYIRAYASMPDVSKINPMNMSHGNAGNISAGEKNQNSGAAGNINLKDKKGSYTCDDLFYAVEKGLKNEGSTITEELLSTMDSMDIVNNALIPALDKIGEEFEKGTLFLPQLIMAAGVAQGAFEVIRKHMVMSNNAPVSKGKIVIATVKGDVHDIGKNIVKVLLENYGYEVIDLGKDVEYQAVVDAIRDNDAKLCGLSALMTTTLVSMKKTIELIHENNLDCKVMVGGAVLTPEYAEEIHADFYSKDAKESVDIAKRVLG